MALNMNIMIIEGKNLAQENGGLALSYQQAVESGQTINISPSQVTDWIYELRGTTYLEMCEQVIVLKQQMRKSNNYKEIKSKIDEMLFIDEVVRVRFSRQADFKKYGKGFTLNGEKYVFILNKGDETITYIKEDLFESINARIEGNRCADYKLVPAKLNAYRSLSMSTSKAVSDCDKLIVVKDCNKTLSNMEYLFVNASQMEVEHRVENVVRNINDGYGFISPRLASVWSKDLGHENIDSAFQVRNLYTKGILATFDFQQFATDLNTFEVVDYWGTVRDIRDADIILSESMLKLAGAYSSCEEWLSAVKEHGYNWRVAKTSKKQKYGYTNYQQILPMSLDEEDCKELLSDSIQMLKDIHGGDWLATTLYLNGDGASNDNLGDYNLAKLIQLEPELVNDYFINQKIQANTRKTKKELLTGRTLINSSFQIIVGDVIAFAQHILGLEPIGFLDEKEIYSAYHRKNGITEATAFRAPLLCENSIVKVKLNQSSDYDKYLTYLDDIYVTSSCDLLNESLCGLI
ncbi:MAG: hypothetical protein [Malazfec virus 1]